MQGLISPFRARAEMRMHNPKDREKQTSISLDVRSSTFEAQPSFGQMPLFHTAIRLAIKSLTVSDFVSYSPLSCLPSGIWAF